MNNIYRYRIPEAGEIIPEGWIKKQMEKDLTEGYVGHFHRIHLTVTHDVFVKQDRLSKRRFSFEKEWWSGEHEGYWKDSVIRMAFLTGNREYIRKSHQWISEILQHTGEDGYIGIYKDGNKRKIRAILFFIIGAGLFWIVYRDLDLEELGGPLNRKR